MVDLDLIEKAYRRGVERAEDLCRHVFGGPKQRTRQTALNSSRSDPITGK